MSQITAEQRFNNRVSEFKKVHVSSRMPDMLHHALQLAMPTDSDDVRSYLLSAVGVRADNKIVNSKNGAVFSTTAGNFQRIPLSHAESRLCRKLDLGSTVYVARLSKLTMSSAMARPCSVCQNHLRAKKVSRVFYTINSENFGIWYPQTDTDKIFSL